MLNLEEPHGLVHCDCLRAEQLAQSALSKMAIELHLPEAILGMDETEAINSSLHGLRLDEFDAIVDLMDLYCFTCGVELPSLGVPLLDLAVCDVDFVADDGLCSEYRSDQDGKEDAECSQD